MPFTRTLCWLLWFWLPVCSAVIPEPTLPKQGLRTISSTDIAAWGFALAVVLGVFFLCVWAMRKLGGLPVGGGEKMRMVGGLSLGMRERVVLLQVGKKQLILGVTPGRIETLLVLEGDDCLQKEDPPSAESGFAYKLTKALKARPELHRNGSN
jgi:flagellar protein FliO/FliZ